MKKLTAVIACLFLLSLLIGCQGSQDTQIPTESTLDEVPPDSQASSSTEESTGVSSQASEESPVIYLPEELSNSYVVDLCNTVRTNDGGTEFPCRLPFVNLPGAAIEAVNADIQTYFKYEEYLNNEACRFTHDYSWYLNGDVLSLLVKDLQWNEVSNCKVYTIRISTCSLMTQKEVLEEAGVDREEYDQNLSNLTANALFDWLGTEGCEKYFGDLANYDEFIHLFTQTTQEWLPEVQPYLNEDGALALFTFIATPAGAGRKPVFLLYTADAPRNPYYDICEDYLALD